MTIHFSEIETSSYCDRLERCGLCHAAVPEYHTRDHEQWHVSQGHLGA